MQESGQGRSVRFITTAMMALTGAAAFIAFSAEDLAGLSPEQRSALPFALIARYIGAMAIGGALSGWLLSGLFGRRRVRGWVLAVAAGLFATLVAGLFGSALGLLPDVLADGWDPGDLIAILAGLLVLPLAAAAQPHLLLPWLGLVALTHLWAGRARARRRDAASRPVS